MNQENQIKMSKLLDEAHIRVVHSIVDDIANMLSGKSITTNAVEKTPLPPIDALRLAMRMLENAPDPYYLTSQFAMGTNYYKKFDKAVKDNIRLIKDENCKQTAFCGIPVVIDHDIDSNTCEARNAQGKVLQVLRA